MCNEFILPFVPALNDFAACEKGTGYAGATCSTCIPDAECMNGGIAVETDGVDGRVCSCQCAAGYEGATCKDKVQCACIDNICTVLVLINKTGLVGLHEDTNTFRSHALWS
jgi:hypothetical protein